MAVQELAYIREVRIAPRVHKPVDQVEVRLSDMAEHERPEGMLKRSISHVIVEREHSSGHKVADSPLEHRARHCRGSSPEEIVSQLLH